MFNINLTSDIFKNPQKICNLGGHFSSKEPCVDKCQIHILDTNFPLTSVSPNLDVNLSQRWLLLFLPSVPLSAITQRAQNQEREKETQPAFLDTQKISFTFEVRGGYAKTNHGQLETSPRTPDRSR